MKVDIAGLTNHQEALLEAAAALVQTMLTKPKRQSRKQTAARMRAFLDSKIAEQDAKIASRRNGT